jgi:hypothetical protein
LVRRADSPTLISNSPPAWGVSHNAVKHFYSTKLGFPYA